MADPLSISASIGALVGLADEVFGRTYKYVKAVKSASKDIITLSSELRALYGILSSLRLVVDQLEGEWTTRAYHLYSCYETLDQMKTILARDDTSSLQGQGIEAMKRKLRWPFTKSEAKELLAKIEQHKSTLGLALNVDSMSGLIRALSRQEDIHEELRGIQNELRIRQEAETRILIDERRREVLKSFGTINPRRNLDMSRKLRHPNTGIWLIESSEFKHWSTSQNALLWLYGIPGAGKTVLASLLIDEVLQKSSPNAAVAYFHCDYKDNATHEPHNILGCLVQQLARQDEQGFKKIEKFYTMHKEDREYPVEYDPKQLCHLIVDIATGFDRAMIVVDGLDECGANTDCITELLASLRREERYSDLKIILLSRDEYDIRKHLNYYPKFSIAAQKRDLRLYVDFEIEDRTRKKKLNIKNLELKELVRKRLVEGAEGMFRWVSCQMDYLCDLPNDAARRRALQDLPRGLNSTYERLLKRVNERDKESQKLVQRTLKWIARGKYRLTTNELCEAVSINFGDKYRDLEAVPDEAEILRNCSSLIRMSSYGEGFEFAHFTVQEFLGNIDSTKNYEFAAYHIDFRKTETTLSKICLTYLNFEEFDLKGNLNKETLIEQRSRYPFRKYAVSYWDDHAGGSDWDDTQLFSLATQLFHPSKPGTLVSWFFDRILLCHYLKDGQCLSKLYRASAEATALHYAALCGLPEICEWLLEKGCDVNERTVFGTPLHCALLHESAITIINRPLNVSFRMTGLLTHKKRKTISLLLEARADPNIHFDNVYINPLHIHPDDASTKVSPLFFDLCQWDGAFTRLLLQKGAQIDNNFMASFLDSYDSIDGATTGDACEILQYIFEHSTQFRVDQRLHDRALQCLLRRRMIHTDKMPSMKFSLKDNIPQTRGNEVYLRTAAEFGQIEVVRQIVDNSSVEVDAVEEGTLLTALHYASMRDHLEVAQVLLGHGASLNQVDSLGRTVLHHCVKPRGCRCLSFFLQQDLDVNARDGENLTVWHYVALENQEEALQVLLAHSKPFLPIDQLQTSKVRSVIGCASQGGSVEAVIRLLNAGYHACDIDPDGCSALHHAAKTGSPEIVRLLIAHGADVKATSDDGSTSIHYAAIGNSARLDEVLDVLIEGGENPFAPRQDGITPVQLLIGDGTDSPNDMVRNKVLQRLCCLPDSFEGKEECLIQSLNTICRLRPTQYSAWPATGLKILLENSAEFLSSSERTISAYRTLTKSWQNEIIVDNGFLVSETTTEMMLTALDHIPLQGPPHEIFTEPALLSSAVKHWNRLLRYNRLDRYAEALFKKLLERSRALYDQLLSSSLLQEACLYKSKMVLMLLEAGIDPNGLSIEGESALMVAARAGNADTVKILLSNGSDVGVTHKSGWNVAHYACAAGHLKVLYALRETDIDWTAKISIRGYRMVCEDATIFHLAAMLKNDSILKYLHKENLITDIDAVTDQNVTALHLATIYSRLTTVSFLLTNNANPTISADWGESAVHMAAHVGYICIMQEFMDYGCDLTLSDCRGLDCEMISKEHGHEELARMIRLYTQRKEGQSSDSNQEAETLQVPEKASEPLRVAIKLGNLVLCQRIVEGGVNLDAQYKSNGRYTALMYSFEEGQPAIAEYLISQGASPAGKFRLQINSTISECSIFHYAAFYNYFEVLRALLERHIDLYLQLTEPLHPLHLAILNRASECVKLIVDYSHKERSHLPNLRVGGFWPNERVETYSTPLHIAVHVSDTVIARHLLDMGALVNEMSAYHRTPLHLAAAQGDVAMVELLVDFKADLQALDDALNTPAMIAAISNHLEAFQRLVINGISPHVVNLYQESLLHAASSSLDTRILLFLLATFPTDWYDLTREDTHGQSALTLAFSSSKDGLPALMNQAFSLQAYYPGKNNILTAAVLNRNITKGVLRMLLRRVPQDLRPILFTHRAQIGGTPLYAACTCTIVPLQTTVIEMLLDAGADLETEGGECGTPLMGACAAGRLPVVKMLIRKGARSSYTRKGQIYSVLIAAKKFPEINRWLLVGRFVEGPGLLASG
ncbi:MAG: hypothetical protein Q9167_004774 [Letrouitia subvulpina]